MSTFKDLTGQKFNRLTVVSLFAKSPARWHCLCDCGETKNVRASHLISSETKSCGCYRNERIRAVTCTEKSKFPYAHVSWTAMKQRVTNPHHTLFHRYGGRGVTICSRWLDNFANFISDMGDRPKGFTLERINNDGNYTPENCKWASRLEQANNTKNTRLITHNDVTLSQAAWSRKLGVSAATVCVRLKKGLNVEGY